MRVPRSSQSSSISRWDPKKTIQLAMGTPMAMETPISADLIGRSAGHLLHHRAGPGCGGRHPALRGSCQALRWTGRKAVWSFSETVDPNNGRFFSGKIPFKRMTWRHPPFMETSTWKDDANGCIL